MDTHRSRALVITAALGLLVTLVPPAVAGGQDGAGWLYVGRDGDILALRPDGTERRNLTQTPDRFEDFPDVSPDGTALYAQFDGLDEEGQFTHEGGVVRIDLTSGAVDDVIPEDVGTYLQPSWGADSSRLYYSNGSDILAVDADGSTEVVVPAPASHISAVHPDGTPDPTTPDRVVYTQVGATGAFAAGYIHHRDFSSDPPQDVRVAAGRYETALDPRFFDGGRQVVFSCGGFALNATFGVCTSSPDEAGTTFTEIPTPGHIVREPAVAPDGTQMAFRGEDGSAWVMGMDGSHPLEVLEPDDGDEFDGDETAFGLDWGPEADLDGFPLVPTPYPAPDTPLEEGGTDVDPATTERARFSDPIAFSVAVSDDRFSCAEGEDALAEYVVLSRDDDFADSLAGSPLTYAGPMLYTPTDALAEVVAEAIECLLLPGEPVYLLGGEAALGPAVEQAVVDLGMTPRRLAGPSRFETAVAVAREVVALGGSGEEVLLARGVGPADNPTAAWADSITGGAYAARARVPILVTPTDTLHPAVRAHLDEVGASVTILGGTSAIAAPVEQQLPGSRRVAGANRAETAARIATELIGWAPTGPLPRTVVFNAYDESGWTFGLAGAGLTSGSSLTAMLVVGQDVVPPETEALLSTCGEPSIETLVLGWTTEVANSVIERINELDGGACG